jgi:hypothetical protein
MPFSKSSVTSLNKRRMITMANEGLQTKPYCTVPAVRLLRKMAMTVKRQPQYGTKF